MLNSRFLAPRPRTTEYIRTDTNHIRPAMPYPSISWMTPRSSIAAEFEPVAVDIDVDPSEDGNSDEGRTESPAGKLNVSCTPFFIVVVVAISCALILAKISESKFSTQDRELESS